MFIELNSGDLVNLYWLDTVIIDSLNKKKVKYIYVNGSCKVETFDTEAEATSRLSEVKSSILK